MVDEIRISWDLMLIIFFGMVIAYSFILGKDSTVKVIIAAYMAILTADSLGTLFNNYLLPASPSLQGETGEQALVLLKIFVFVLVIVVLTVRGGFRVELMPERSLPMRLLSNLSFGFLNAGLMVSTFLVYLTGGGFADQSFSGNTATNLYRESQFIQLMMDNHAIWFALPAIAIVLVSFFEAKED